jgi:vancomycin permeability regulator SanA
LIRLASLWSVSLVAIYLGFFLVFAVWPRSGNADLSVVLGNQVLPDGQPTARLAARLDEGARCYHAGLAPLILVTGGHERNGWDEADVMRAYLLARNVPAAAILEDHAGNTTWASAINTAALMRARHLTSVLIVTQYFHVPRCMLAFRLAGIGTMRAAYPRYADSRDPYSVVREMVALPAYALRLYRRSPV